MLIELIKTLVLFLSYHKGIRKINRRQLIADNKLNALSDWASLFSSFFLWIVLDNTEFDIFLTEFAESLLVKRLHFIIRFEFNRNDKFQKGEKMKKILISSIAALAFTCTLTGCGTDSGTNKPSEAGSAISTSTSTTITPSLSEKQEVTTRYQFTANYDELLSFGFVYDFLFNFQSDNHAQIYIYANAGKENEDLRVINATWKAKKIDGEDCLELNDKINPDGKYTIYQDQGTYTIEDYYFTFSGSYSRKINVPGSATIQYAAVDAWKDATKERVSKLNFGSSSQGGEEEETVLVTFTSGSSTLAFNSDKTGELSGFGGQVKESFGWEVTDGNLAITGDNASKFTLTKKEDSAYDIEYKVTDSISIKFENLDCTALGIEKHKEVALEFTNSSAAKLSFYKDNTGTLDAYSGKVVRDFTWAVADAIVSLEGVNGDASFSCTKGGDGKYTVEYTITAQRKITFEDLDFSALLA